MAAVACRRATTVVAPDELTWLNVTRDNWAGATCTLAPDGVLNNVATARTTSALTVVYSLPATPSVTMNGKPSDGNWLAMKQATADWMAASVPAPPTAPSPITT